MSRIMLAFKKVLAKSFVMTPLADNMDEKENWEYAMEILENDNIMEKTSVKGSQVLRSEERR